LKKIKSLDPLDFEALFAAIFEECGNETYLTSERRDRGVDVIVIPREKDKSGLLIQVKHSKKDNKIGPSAISQIIAAKKLYEEKYRKRFSCAVATNIDFTSDAKELAHANQVELFNSKWLEDKLKRLNIYFHQLRKLSLSRVSFS
jgi:HJR/Mrr/RecB family endonuclease